MDPRTLKRVDGIVRTMIRSWVINQAVARYLDYEESGVPLASGVVEKATS